MRDAGLEPGIVAIGAVLNAAKKSASATSDGVAIVQEAWDLFNTIEKDERNAFVYSSMIGAFGEAKMSTEAVDLFEEAASHLKPWYECSACPSSRLASWQDSTVRASDLVARFVWGGVGVWGCSHIFDDAGPQRLYLMRPTTPLHLLTATSLAIGGCVRLKTPRS